MGGDAPGVRESVSIRLTQIKLPKLFFPVHTHTDFTEMNVKDKGLMQLQQSH